MPQPSLLALNRAIGRGKRARRSGAPPRSRPGPALALATLVLHRSGYEGIRYAFVDCRFNEDRDAYCDNLARLEHQAAANSVPARDEPTRQR